MCRFLSNRKTRYMNAIKWEDFKGPEEEFGSDLNIYIGHTNFEITNKHIDILDSIEGIEAVNNPSRYRFLVFVGKCFEWSKIKTEIENSFGCSLDTSSIKLEMVELMLKKYKEFDSLYDFWVAYMFPNQNIIVKHSHSINTIIPHIQNLSNLKKLSGGILMVPDKLNSLVDEHKQKDTSNLQKPQNTKDVEFGR